MTTSTPPTPLPAPWRGLIDDAAIFPPGDAAFPDAVEAFTSRQGEWYADLVGSFVVRDIDLGHAPADIPLAVVLTTGAGAVEGVVHKAARSGLTLTGLEVALRDFDDLAGNVRRVDAAVRACDTEIPVHVEIPGPVTASWLAAADEVAAVGQHLKLRLGHVDHELIPVASTIVSWIDAALERETSFKATAGLHRAIRHEPDEGGAHGFLNVLAATAFLWDGGSTAEAAEVIEDRDGAALAAMDVSSARRWLTSIGSCSVIEPRDDLVGLGLLAAPA